MPPRNYVNPSIPKDQIFWVMNLIKYTLKVYLFVKITLQKLRLKYQGARDGTILKMKIDIFIKIAPTYFVLNISTSPPSARNAEKFRRC